MVLAIRILDTRRILLRLMVHLKSRSTERLIYTLQTD